MAKIIRVMVAEDFPLLREDFCDVVSAQSDMEVVGSAASGEEIASLADTVPCDVILMDIEMETIDAGIRAAEVITARHPEVKILFLTAHETDDMITSAMGTGAVDYVVKGCEEERSAGAHPPGQRGAGGAGPKDPEHRHAGVRPSAPQRALPDFLHQQRGPPDA
ncbi:MAG: response regulator transcription factor [Flavonifractor plautii]